MGYRNKTVSLFIKNAEQHLRPQSNCFGSDWFPASGPAIIIDNGGGRY